MSDLLDMEQPLINLEAVYRILLHLAVSERTAEKPELKYLADTVRDSHEQLDRVWKDALAERSNGWKKQFGLTGIGLLREGRPFSSHKMALSFSF